MSNFGHDFQAGSPNDGDYVRRPSGTQLGTTLRDIGARIVSFFGRKFDLTTGDLLNADATSVAGVPSAALKSLSPSPEGEWTSVTVNSKGLVTRGRADVDTGAPRLFSAFYFADSSVSSVDTVDGSQVAIGTPDHTPGGDFDNAFYPSDIFDFVKFEFVVPEGVYRVRAFVVGAGYSHPVGSALDRAGQRDIAFSTTPGSILKIWVGVTNGAPSRVSSADGSEYVDSEQVQHPTDFPDVSPTWKGPEIPYYGTNGTASSTEGKSGCVILEWYA